MKKLKRRILSFVLIFTMVLTMIPFSVTENIFAATSELVQIKIHELTWKSATLTLDSKNRLVAKIGNETKLVMVQNPNHGNCKSKNCNNSAKAAPCLNWQPVYVTPPTCTSDAVFKMSGCGEAGCNKNPYQISANYIKDYCTFFQETNPSPNYYVRLTSTKNNSHLGRTVTFGFSINKTSHNYVLTGSYERSNCEVINQYACSVCEATTEASTGTYNHSYVEDTSWMNDAANYPCGTTHQSSNICSKCNNIVPGAVRTINGHVSYDLYAIQKYGNILDLPENISASVTPATCTEDGKIIYKCSRCGWEQHVIIPKREHSITAINQANETNCTIETEEATCTGSGKRNYYCNRDNYDIILKKNGLQTGVTTLYTSCESKIFEETIAALGHVVDNRKPISTTPTTCESDGTSTQTCARCGEEYTFTTNSALGHAYILDKRIAATCTENEHLYKICTRCGDNGEFTNDEYSVNTYGPNGTKIERKPATGHTYTITYTKPTCTANGYYTLSCTCGNKQEDISQLNIVIASRNGNTIKSTDGNTYIDETNQNLFVSSPVNNIAGKKTGHEFHINYTKPTCMDAGYYTYKCKICNSTGDDGDFVNYYPGNREDGNTWINESGRTAPAESKVACDYTIIANRNIVTGIESEDVGDGDIHYSTCKNKGYIEYTCKYGCEKTRKGIPKYSIDSAAQLGTPILDAEGNSVIEYGKYWNLVDHRYNKEVIPAECECDGYTSETCIWCGAYRRTDIVEALGHNYEEIGETKPTCVESGEILGKCTRCKTVDTIQTIKATGIHDFVFDHKTEATCTENGETVYVCSMCNDEKIETTKATGVHDFVFDHKVNPTCTENGETVYVCSMCKDEKIENIPATNKHNYIFDHETVPTCTETGEKIYICSMCKDEKVETIPMLSHVYEPTTVFATCEEDGYTINVCKLCGALDESSKNLLKALGHIHVTTQIQKATFNTDGSLKITCDDCGQLITSDIISKPDVEYDESKLTFTYNGKDHKPKVTLPGLVKGIDYTVTYLNSKIGKGTVRITLTGTKYEGIRNIYFKTNLLTVTDISIKSKKAKQMSISYDKYPKAMCEIQYSTNKKFRTSVKKVKVNAKTYSKTISKLKSKKVYYVRMRSYIIVDKKTYYSNWSKTKSVRIK